MDRDDVIHLRDCITAWLSGDIIEEKPRKESTQNIAEWTPYEGDHAPLFNMEEYLYREKPKPREFWAGVDENGKGVGITASLNSGSIPAEWYEVIKVIEVLT